VRSYLYVPGNAPDKLAKALDRGADALIVDLADAVSRDGEPAVRAEVAAWLRTVPAEASVWVRINPGPVGHDDARHLVGPGLRGLCVARTESTTQLDALDAVLSTVETEAGLPHRAVAVIPVLESAGAILAAPGLARAARVLRLQLGETYLLTELGLEPSRDERELLWARSQVVLAGAAGGLLPPIGPAFPDLDDMAGLRSSTDGLRRLGFSGRACLHPDQLAPVNEIFPTH
jgi:citrate lyase subunit beta/citryl-CoA lyase